MSKQTKKILTTCVLSLAFLFVLGLEKAQATGYYCSLDGKYYHSGNTYQGIYYTNSQDACEANCSFTEKCETDCSYSGFTTVNLPDKDALDACSPLLPADWPGKNYGTGHCEDYNVYTNGNRCLFNANASTLYTCDECDFVCPLEGGSSCSSAEMDCNIGGYCVPDYQCRMTKRCPLPEYLCQGEICNDGCKDIVGTKSCTGHGPGVDLVANPSTDFRAGTATTISWTPDADAVYCIGSGSNPAGFIIWNKEWSVGVGDPQSDDVILESNGIYNFNMRCRNTGGIYGVPDDATAEPDCGTCPDANTVCAGDPRYDACGDPCGTGTWNPSSCAADTCKGQTCFNGCENENGTKFCPKYKGWKEVNP